MIYIVKINHNGQGNNLGVHSSKKKALDHYDIVVRHHLNHGGTINWESSRIVDCGGYKEIRQINISHPNSQGIKVIIEAWNS